MSHRELNYEEFYDQAWDIVELIKYHVENNSFPIDIGQKLNLLYSLLVKFKKTENTNFQDIEVFFRNILGYTKTSSLSELTLNNFKNCLDKFVFGEPYEFSFYFNLGKIKNFPSGYKLGTGTLIPFDELKESDQKHATRNWRKSDDLLNENENIRKETWYMNIKVQSVGYFKAAEKASIAVKTNINIYKLVNRDFSLPLLDTRGFNDFWGENVHGIKILIKEDDENLICNPFLHTRDENDDFRVFQFNEIINSNERTELEARLLNVVDLQGMIDSSAPLHVKFLLCVISLETLLMDKSEKDYLGWKLAEKLAFLVADSKWWFNLCFRIPAEQQNTITTAYIFENLLKSRFELEKTVKNIYEKRSNLAHMGLSKKAKEISEDDFYILYNLVGIVVEKIMELRKVGIERVGRDETDDDKSLNSHIRMLKYS